MSPHFPSGVFSLATLAALALAIFALVSCTESGELPPSTPGGGASPTATRQPQPIESPTGDQQEAQVTRIIDGDTIEVRTGGQTYRVRYIGIDTPESVDPRQPVQCFGRESSERNRQLVAGRTVKLEKDVSETDSFGRLLRYVLLDGQMVNAILVEEGYALAATYPPDVRYADLFQRLQEEARLAVRGLWSECIEPRTFTSGGPCEYSAGDQPMIKGNISQNTGEKIYHVPGGEFYEATVINETAGERWFCTESEALAAGWRRSKR